MPVANISVDTTRRFQTVTGWETAPEAGQQQGSAYALYRDSLLNLAVNDLGLTRIRIELRSGIENPVDVWAEQRAGRRPPSRCGRYTTINDNDDPLNINPAGFHFSELDYTIEHLVLPMKRVVEARGEKLFLNANYVSFMKQCPREARYDHATAAEYAEFVLAAYLHLRDKYGLVPDTWEVILEPENTWFWHGRQIGQAIVAAGRLLEQHGFKPRFIAPSTAKAGNAPRYFDEMMAVPGVPQYLEELSYHRYGGYVTSDFVAIARRAAAHHVKTSMLEHIGAGYRELHLDLTVAGVSAWQQFALAYPSENDNGAQYYLIENAGGKRPEIRLAQRTRYLRQYLRYIRPGAVRVEATSNRPGVDPVAFLAPDGRKVMVVKCDGPARIVVVGFSAGRYRSHYTTADVTDATGAVTQNGNRTEFGIPAKGVVTLFSDGAEASRLTQRNF